jgi:lipopolysaccharide transport system permease protein
MSKKSYPLEILPVVSLGSALFHTMISLAVWLVAYFVFFDVPHLTVLYFPLILLPLMIITLGLSWILASLGVYLRDINQFITLFTTALMFLSPVFYSAEILPPEFRQLMYFNPLTTVIEQTRNVLYWGKQPDFDILAVYWVAAFIIAWIGFAWFQKTRKGFADVL